jgi:hypothetical protein
VAVVLSTPMLTCWCHQKRILRQITAWALCTAAAACAAAGEWNCCSVAQHLTPPCAICLNLNAHSVSLPPDVVLQATFCLAGGALPTLNLDRLPVPLPNILLVGCVTGLGTHWMHIDHARFTAAVHAVCYMHYPWCHRKARLGKPFSSNPKKLLSPNPKRKRAGHDHDGTAAVSRLAWLVLNAHYSAGTASAVTAATLLCDWYHSSKLNWHCRPYKPALITTNELPGEGLLLVKAQQLHSSLT